MKALFGLLLLLSIILFALMQWGGELTRTARNGQLLPEQYADKIRLLETPSPKSAVPSVVIPVQTIQAVSSVIAIPASAPAVSASLPAQAAVSASAATNVLALKPTEKKAAAKAEIKSCMEWGEFSGADLARAEKELAGIKLGGQLSTRIVEYSSGYWVYIPPLGSSALAAKRVRQIKARGVEEYFVVQEPPHWANAISLGVFKTQEAARNFQFGLNKKGIHSAKVGERKGRLKFIVFVFKQIGVESVSRLSAMQKDFANSELKSIVCKK